MEIRKLEDNDIPKVVDFWYDTSIVAHDFIPAEYWKRNKEAMANEYLPNSETYVAIKNEEIVGFIAIVDNYLAALFVKIKLQRNGTGRFLLNYIKEARETIQLKVYVKNPDSIGFYLSQGFNILSEGIDKDTNEPELLMEWNK